MVACRSIEFAFLSAIDARDRAPKAPQGGDRGSVTDDAEATFATLRRKTAPQLLCERARATPDAVAFRSKHLGLYRERTWRDYAAAGRRVARSGCARSASRKGERVAIMGDACEEWMIVRPGRAGAGAIVYGIYPTASVVRGRISR